VSASSAKGKMFLAVSCPRCKAPARLTCRAMTGGFKLVQAHVERKREWRKWYAEGLNKQETELLS